MFFSLQAIALLLLHSTWANAFPSYQSLAGLSNEEVEHFIRESRDAAVVGAEPPPGPLNDTSSKLVNDADHPYETPGPNDLRGPCPGLNALASHGVNIFYVWTQSSGN